MLNNKNKKPLIKLRLDYFKVREEKPCVCDKLPQNLLLVSENNITSVRSEQTTLQAPTGVRCVFNPAQPRSNDLSASLTAPFKMTASR